MPVFELLTSRLQSLGGRSTARASTTPNLHDLPSSHVTLSAALDRARLESASADERVDTKPGSETDGSISAGCCNDEDAHIYRELLGDIPDTTQEGVGVGSTAEDGNSARVGPNDGVAVRVLESPPTSPAPASDYDISSPVLGDVAADALLREVREQMALLRGEVECNGTRVLDTLEEMRVDFSHRLDALEDLRGGEAGPVVESETSGKGVAVGGVTQREAEHKERAEFERVRSEQLMEQMESLRRQTVQLMLENEELRREAKGLRKELKG